MQGLLRFSNTIDRITEKIGKTVMWSILIAVFICSLNAILRKLFDTSDFFRVYTNSMSEMQQFLFGCIFLLGASYTLLRDGHVRIDVLSGRWSQRTQIKMDVIGILLFMLPACLLIFYFSLNFFTDSFHNKETSGNSPLVLWPFKLLLPVGYFILIIQGISELIKRLAYFKGLIPFSELRHSSHNPADEVKSYLEKIDASNDSTHSNNSKNLK